MAITVEWANEQKTAFCWTFEGRWTWIEYSAGMQRSNTLAREVSHRIDVIVDMRNSGVVPTSALSYIKFERADQPEKMGRIVVVGASPLVRTIILVLGRLNHDFDVRFQIVKTIDEAYKILASPPTQ
jgi:hypothetical protein